MKEFPQSKQSSIHNLSYTTASNPYSQKVPVTYKGFQVDGNTFSNYYRYINPVHSNSRSQLMPNSRYLTPDRAISQANHAEPDANTSLAKNSSQLSMLQQNYLLNQQQLKSLKN